MFLGAGRTGTGYAHTPNPHRPTLARSLAHLRQMGYGVGRRNRTDGRTRTALHRPFSGRHFQMRIEHQPPLHCTAHEQLLNGAKVTYEKVEAKLPFNGEMRQTRRLWKMSPRHATFSNEARERGAFVMNCGVVNSDKLRNDHLSIFW